MCGGVCTSKCRPEENLQHPFSGTIQVFLPFFLLSLPPFLPLSFPPSIPPFLLFFFLDKVCHCLDLTEQAMLVEHRQACVLLPSTGVTSKPPRLSFCYCCCCRRCFQRELWRLNSGPLASKSNILILSHLPNPPISIKD